ncbi:MAG: hypothetical protein ACK4ON_12045, partial [Bacteroidia bacterium]
TQITNPLLSICNGDTAQLNTISSGNSPFTYQWIPSTGLSSSTVASPLVFPLVSTNYQLIVTDSLGCFTDTLLAFVEVFSLPLLDAGDDDTLCLGQGTFLNPTVSGLPGSYNFAWFPSTGLNNPNIKNPFAQPTVTTTYTVISSSNLYGCQTNVDTITIYIVDNQPQFAGNDTSICLGSSVQIGSPSQPNRQYFWSPSIGLSNPNISDPIANPSFTTTYYLQFSEFGCLSNVDSITISVLGLPTVDAGDSVEICPRTSVQLNAIASGVPGPFTYTWSPTLGLDNPNLQNPNASPNVTTMYYVFASANGCDGVTDSVLVVVKPEPIVDADTTNSTYHICQGDTVYLPGKVISTLQPVTLRWLPSTYLSDSTTATPFAVPQESIRYYLQAEAGGCYSTIDSVDIKVTPKLDIKIS